MPGCEPSSLLDPTWAFSNHLCTSLYGFHQKGISFFPGVLQALLRCGNVAPASGSDLQCSKDKPHRCVILLHNLKVDLRQAYRSLSCNRVFYSMRNFSAYSFGRMRRRWQQLEQRDYGIIGRTMAESADFTLAIVPGSVTISPGGAAQTVTVSAFP